MSSGDKGATKTLTAKAMQYTTTGTYWSTDAIKVANAVANGDNSATATITAKAQKDYSWNADAFSLANAAIKGNSAATATITAKATKATDVTSNAVFPLVEGTNTIKRDIEFKPSWQSSALNSLKSFLGLKAEGGIFSGGTWKNLPQFANGGIIRRIAQYAGGTLRAGSMFVAGEAGPEIVGHINGRTEVLNKSQIASAIYSAVLAGMEAAVNGLGRYLASHMTVCTNAVISALTLTRTPSTVSLSNVDSAMLSRVAALQAIPYQVPAYATGTVMPYEVVAEIRKQTSELKTAIHDEGEAIIQAIVSAISNHGIATTSAIRNIPAGQQTYSADYLVQSTIDEINRRTLAYGQSSLI